MSRGARTGVLVKDAASVLDGDCYRILDGADSLLVITEPNGVGV